MNYKQRVKKRLIGKENVIVDSHTHSSGISVQNFLHEKIPLTLSVKELVRNLKENGVDYAISSPFPNPPSFDIGKVYIGDSNVLFRNQSFVFEKANRNFLKECSYFGEEHILPFMLVDLRIDQEAQLDFIKNHRDELFGVKVHTTCLNESIQEMNGLFADSLKELNLPVLVHTKENSSFANTLEVIEFAKNHPNIRICAAHLAGFSESHLMDIRDIPNLFVDVSPFLSLCRFANNGNQSIIAKDKLFLDYSDPQQVLFELCTIYRLEDSLLWGSDFPWNGDDRQSTLDYRPEIDLLKQMSSNIVRSICQVNSARFLFG